MLIIVAVAAVSCSLKQPNYVFSLTMSIYLDDFISGVLVYLHHVRYSVYETIITC